MLFVRNQNMEWTEEHDIFLCREVLVLDPFQYPYRRKERGDVWGQLAIHLNSLIHPQFKVSKRSVRDRLTLLQTRYKEKMKREEMASGIDCEESELDRALDEIIEKEKFADTNRNESSSAQAKKDKAEAEEQRLKAVERLGETAKRQADTDGKEIKPKKARSGSETLVYLRDKFEHESEYKKEELALRVKELENKDALQKMMADQQKLIQQQQHDMLQMMQKQQAKQDEQIQSFQMMFLQQQQQQSKIWMALLESATSKKNS